MAMRGGVYEGRCDREGRGGVEKGVAMRVGGVAMREGEVWL